MFLCLQVFSFLACTLYNAEFIFECTEAKKQKSIAISSEGYSWCLCKQVQECIILLSVLEFDLLPLTIKTLATFVLSLCNY